MTTQCLNGKGTTRFLLLSLTIPLFLPFLVSTLRSLKSGRVGHTPVKWHFSSLVSRRLVQSVAQPLHIRSMRVTSSRLYHIIWWKTQWIQLVQHNCLKAGQIKQCFSSQWCCRCQKQHHTLQYVEVKARKATSSFLNFAVYSISLFSFSLIYPSISHISINSDPNPCGRSVLSHVAQSVTHCSHSLLMTACVLISFPHSASIQAKALLDSAFSSLNTLLNCCNSHAPSILHKLRGLEA